MLVGIDETKLSGRSMRVEVDDRALERALGCVTRAVARQVHGGFGLAAPAVGVETVQAASLVDERDGVEERSVHVLRGATDEEGNVVNRGNFGDVAHRRRPTQGLRDVIARGLEGEASAVEGGVGDVKEPNDRELEDDVGQEVNRDSAKGEQDGLLRVLDGKPRGGLSVATKATRLSVMTEAARRSGRWTRENKSWAGSASQSVEAAKVVAL